MKLRSRLLSAVSTLWVLLSSESIAGPGEDMLMRALRSSNHQGVAVALERGADPNRLLPDGSTPLAWAAEIQDAEMVRLLLAAGADPNASANPAVAPLLVACQHGDRATLEQLLGAGADVHVATAEGVSAFSLCAGHAPVMVLKTMTAAGVEVDAPDEHGQTPLMHAAANGMVNNVKLLVGRGADVNHVSSRGITPLFFAAQSKVLEAALVLIEAGADADYIAPQQTTLVQMASYHGNHALVSWLVEQGVDLKAYDREGNQLLHAAIIAQQADLVAQLIAKGADVNALTGPSRIELRLEPDAVGTDNSYTPPAKAPLILAAERGFTDIMQHLAAAGADTSFRMAEDGSNIVLAATGSMNPDALRLALQLHPDANSATARGKTPLHQLLGGGGSKDEIAVLMELLREYGAKPDLADRRGTTAEDMLASAQAGPRDAFVEVFHSSR